jgi:hypothetical protein
MLRNGNRNVDDLIRHLDTDLVQWASTPGVRWDQTPRTTPPISHEEFKNAFVEWLQGGADCPTE